MIDYYHCDDCGTTADGDRFPIDDYTEGTICGRCGSDNCHGIENDEAEAKLAINPLLVCVSCEWYGHRLETVNDACPDCDMACVNLYAKELA